jgi:hypothetical protein
MASVNGIDTTSITNCLGITFGDISKMSGVTLSTPLTKQSIFRPGTTSGNSIVNRIIMPTTQEPTTDLRLTEADSFTINFWVKAGWTSALGTQGGAVGFVCLGANATTPGRTDSAYNNVFRIFYNESNNRLYVGWLNYTSSTNRYAQAYWPLHVRPNTGLGSTYWSSSNRGNVNANGYTMITITVSGTTSGTAIMSRANVKGYWNTTTIGDTWVTNGEQNGDPNLTTTDPRGMALVGLTYGGSGTLDGTGGGGYGGNGTGTYLDEVSIWDGILSSSEITALYNSGNGGSISKDTKPSNLIAYWNFDSDSTGTEGGEPFAYPVWPDPSTNSNLGKVYISGSSDFASGGTNIIS